MILSQHLQNRHLDYWNTVPFFSTFCWGPVDNIYDVHMHLLFYTLHLEDNMRNLSYLYRTLKCFKNIKSANCILSIIIRECKIFVISLPSFSEIYNLHPSALACWIVWRPPRQCPASCAKVHSAPNHMNLNLNIILDI